MNPMKSSKKRLEQLVGKPVLIHDSGSSNYGILTELDFSNGFYVLNDVPFINYAAQELQKNNGVLVPMASKTITEIPKEQLEAFAKYLGRDIQYIGKFVEISSRLGKLNEIKPNHYELKPFLTQSPKGARWETEMPMFVPRENNTVIVPIEKEDIEAVIKYHNSKNGTENISTVNKKQKTLF
jgi:hypothetical protein